ncbi:MAG: hypothetical protein ACRECW_07565 [Phyllobacterium sp.]
MKRWKIRTFAKRAIAASGVIVKESLHRSQHCSRKIEQAPNAARQYPVSVAAIQCRKKQKADPQF